MKKLGVYYMVPNAPHPQANREVGMDSSWLHPDSGGSTRFWWPSASEEEQIHPKRNKRIGIDPEKKRQD